MKAKMYCKLMNILESALNLIAEHSENGDITIQIYKAIQQIIIELEENY